MTCRWRRQRGLSILEFTFLVIIIGILMVIAMEKILRLDVDAERVAVQRVVGSLQSALTIEFADRVVHQGLETTADLDRINPVSVTAAPPATYVGEFRESVPAGVEKGQWFFDTRSRTLVYLVRNDAWFESPLGAPQRARFQVELVFDDRNANGRYDRGIDKIEGVRLTPAEDFTWRKAPRN